MVTALFASQGTVWFIQGLGVRVSVRHPRFSLRTWLPFQPVKNDHFWSLERWRRRTEQKSIQCVLEWLAQAIIFSLSGPVNVCVNSPWMGNICCSEMIGSVCSSPQARQQPWQCSQPSTLAFRMVPEICPGDKLQTLFQLLCWVAIKKKEKKMTGNTPIVSKIALYCS